MKEGNNLFFGFLYAVYVTWSAYIGVPEETTSIVQIVATFNTIKAVFSSTSKLEV